MRTGIKAGTGVRAGTKALALLARPINVHVLQALAESPKSLTELRRETGSPPEATIRGYVRTLAETGVLKRRRPDDFAPSLDLELTAPGRDLLTVAEALRGWLSVAPEGPLQPGSPPAKSAVKALVEGWDTCMMRALAAHPVSLAELDGLIPGLNYPTLKRRLAAMRLVGQVQKMPGRGGSTPYIATEWLRRAVAPLSAAVRWEYRHLGEHAAPIAHRDAEAAFLLAAPLLRLPADLTGSCRIAVALRNGSGHALAGVMLRAEEGSITECIPRLEGHPEAWATGPAEAWLAAMIDCDTRSLELGGDSRLATELIGALHGALFGAADPSSGVEDSSRRAATS